MKVTTISKRKFRELQPLILGQEICNSESEVFNLNIRGEHKVLKVLKEQSGEYYANKLYTV